MTPAALASATRAARRRTSAVASASVVSVTGAVVRALALIRSPIETAHGTRPIDARGANVPLHDAPRAAAALQDLPVHPKLRGDPPRPGARDRVGPRAWAEASAGLAPTVPRRGAAVRRATAVGRAGPREGSASPGART